MSDPYEVLGIARDAGEAEVRRRYLELVREFPPDRQPEQFVAVRTAYEQLRDPITRLRAMLFDRETSESLVAIQADVRRRLRAARIPVKTLLSLAGRA
jgi:curved DNA-binding protein CbpA